MVAAASEIKAALTRALACDDLLPDESLIPSFGSYRQEVLHIEYEFGTRDYGAIASRVKEANPDLLWGGTNGVDPVLMYHASRNDFQPS